MFNNETKQIRESVQKREDVIFQKKTIKLSNELDELKAFKDVPSTKIEDIKTNLNKVSGSSLTEKMQTLKELKPDLFVEEQPSVSPTNFIKDMIENLLKIKMMKLKLLKKKEHILLRKLKN
ncbi:MAG: hypothetical protein CXB60_10780 [Spiroplasma poulsonii]|nr:hypothetical protein [Spiroplasma poulsonii]